MFGGVGGRLLSAESVVGGSGGRPDWSSMACLGRRDQWRNLGGKVQQIWTGVFTGMEIEPPTFDFYVAH